MVLVGIELVNFLHRGSCNAVLWIFDQNSGDNAIVFCLPKKPLH